MKSLEYLVSSSRAYLVGWAIDNVPSLLRALLARKRDKSLHKSLSSHILKLENHRMAIALALTVVSYKYLENNPLLGQVSMRGKDDLGAQSRKSSVVSHDVHSSEHQKKRLNKIFKAASISALCLYIIPMEKRLELTLLLFVRALDIVVSSRFSFDHSHGFFGIVFVFSTWEVLYSWFYSRESIPKAFTKFITKFSDMDQDLIQFLRWKKEGKLDYMKELGYGYEDILKNYCEAKSIDPSLGDPRIQSFIKCNPVVHDGMTCEAHALTRFQMAFLRSLSLYIPLYMVPFMISLIKRNQKKNNSSSKINDEKETHVSIRKPLLSILRSSIFLASLVGTIWYTVCKLRNYFKNDHVITPTLATLAGTLTIIIEKPERRTELAMYVMPRALYSVFYRSVWLRWTDAQRKLFTPLLDLLLTGTLCSSFAIIVSRAIVYPENMKPAIKGIISFLLDVENNNEEKKQ
ncbi:hypothetical protein MP638_005566 [Amoeboaphelidium occidentale]|nr:hypothetical protein MP638_005566 [Amoeboaphelidium occidentale]